MGALHAGKCYLSQSDAAAAFFQGAAPSVTSGQTSFVTAFENVGGVWKSVGYSVDAAGVWSLRYASNAVVPTFPDCDPAENFKDGVVIGWGISSALIIAACIKLIQRGR